MHRSKERSDAWLEKHALLGRIKGQVSSAAHTLAETSRLVAATIDGESTATAGVVHSSGASSTSGTDNVTSEPTSTTANDAVKHPVVLECRVVRATAQKPAATQVTCVFGAQVLWVTRLSGVATHACGNEQIVAVATSDGSLHLFTAATGRRIVPAIATGARLAFVSVPKPARSGTDVDAQLVLCVNVRGDLRMWDFARRKLQCECSVTGLLTSQMYGNNGTRSEGSASRASHLAGVDVDSQGNIVAHVSAFNDHGAGAPTDRIVRAYLWDISLKAWLRASCEDFVHSTFYSTFISRGARLHHRSSQSSAGFPLEQLQATARRKLEEERIAAGQPATIASVRSILSELPEWSMVDTISHLQHQLALSVALHDANSFQSWLRVYVRRGNADFVTVPDRLSFTLSLLLTDQVSCTARRIGVDQRYL